MKSYSTFERTKFFDKKSTNQILFIDYSYIEPLVLNYSGDNCFLDKAIRVGDKFHVKPEFSCELCGSGRKSSQYRPACFYPTDIGYWYKCKDCEANFTLYQYLRERNPEIAKKYSIERWIRGFTGSSYNCPNPPKNWRAEWYQRKEREEKERNKRAYEERMKKEKNE